MKTRMFIGLIVLLLIIGSTVSFAQTNTQSVLTMSDSTALDTLYKFHAELQKKKADKAMLERIIESLNLVDSVYRVHYPTWIIHDEDIRQRIIKAFRNRQKPAPQRTPIHVITNPTRDEIAELSVLGASSMGRGEVRLYMSESLQQAVLQSYSSHSEVGGAEEAPTKSLLPNIPPDKISFEVSMFGGSLRFADGWGAEVKVGYDEIGFPFWSSGSAKMMMLMNQLKLGIMVPVNTGLSKPDLLGPVTILERKLNGAPGVVAEFFQPIGSYKIETRFSSGSMTKKELGDQITDTSSAYFIHTTGQLVFSADFSLSRGDYLFTVKGGVGFHRIGEGVVKSDRSINVVDKINYVSPYVKLEHIHHGTQMYGFSVQYYSSIVLLAAWTELVKNFVYIDVKYSTPLFRPPHPWEQPYFFMLSPRFRFAF